MRFLCPVWISFSVFIEKYSVYYSDFFLLLATRLVTPSGRRATFEWLRRLCLGLITCSVALTCGLISSPTTGFRPPPSSLRLSSPRASTGRNLQVLLRYGNLRLYFPNFFRKRPIFLKLFSFLGWEAVCTSGITEAVTPGRVISILAAESATFAALGRVTEALSSALSKLSDFLPRHVCLNLSCG